jgi:hypothetical protein
MKRSLALLAAFVIASVHQTLSGETLGDDWTYSVTDNQATIQRSSSMNKIEIGMTKEEVISAMGNPGSTASPGGGVEVLRFNLYDLVSQWMEYFVRFENGKVASYGRMGDFDSTKDPTQNINVKVKEE